MKNDFISSNKSNFPSIHLENSAKEIQDNDKKYSYCKALKELKDIDKQIWTMKNRLNLL